MSSSTPKDYNLVQCVWSKSRWLLKYSSPCTHLTFILARKPTQNFNIFFYSGLYLFVYSTYVRVIVILDVISHYLKAMSFLLSHYVQFWAINNLLRISNALLLLKWNQMSVTPTIIASLIWFFDKYCNSNQATKTYVLSRKLK